MIPVGAKATSAARPDRSRRISTMAAITHTSESKERPPAHNSMVRSCAGLEFGMPASTMMSMNSVENTVQRIAAMGKRCFMSGADASKEAEKIKNIAQLQQIAACVRATCYIGIVPSFAHMKKHLLLFALIAQHGAFAQSWTQIGLNIVGEAPDDVSGSAVSMPDANTVAIGAPDNSSDAGQVRVYAWSGSAWSQKGADLDGLGIGAMAGRSVSMPDANTVAFGAPFINTEKGLVRIYEWTGSAWTQKGLDLQGDAILQKTGYSVSMPDANTIAIAAPGCDDGGNNTGQVRVYGWSGTAWVQQGANINGEGIADQSGFSVSMPDANTVAIGAPGNIDGGTDAGHARVYAWDGSAWVQKGADLDGEAGDGAGASLSMPDANTLAVAAGGHNSTTGRVRVYEWSGSAWVQKGMGLDGDAAGDMAGFSLSMPDANTVAIGAPGNSANGFYAGRVWVYEWSSSIWVQKGADLAGLGSHALGWAVSMPDANTLAVGSIGTYLSAGHVGVFSASPVGIMESDASSWVAYPNPTNGLLTLEIGQLHDDLTVSVTNALGQEVSRMQLPTASQRITLWLDGPSGVYLVNVISDAGILGRMKVFKE